MTTDLQASIAIALVLVYAFFALLDNAIGRLTPLDLKLIPEQFPAWRQDRFLSMLAVSKAGVQIPLTLMLQLLLLALALLVNHLLLATGVSYALLITLAVLAVLVLLLQHLLPWALVGSDHALAVRRLYPFFRPFHRLLYPLCYPVVALALKRESSEDNGETPATEATEAEVQAYLDVGAEEGIFEPDEGKLIQQVVEFGDTMVREIMTPRTEITAIRNTATLQELKDLMVASRHSRIPVFHDSIDAIQGTVYVRHLLTAYTPETAAAPFTGLVRPAFFVPETKKVAELLREMQSRGDNMAVVVDEYGGIAGLVTLEDLLEEIVGEIRDEDQHEEEDIVEESPGVFVMRGDTEIGRVEEKCGADLHHESYNTAAGMVIKHLGRFPLQDETFEYQGLQIKVLEVDSRKVVRIQVAKITPAEPEE